MELVERVGSHAHRQEEREHGEPEAAPGGIGDEAAARDDVGEVPGGVGEVEQGDDLPPATGAEGVPGGPHPRRPQTTIPPPRLSRRLCASTMPASRHVASSASSGRVRQKETIDGPRKRPTSIHSRDTSRPAPGSNVRT